MTTRDAHAQIAPLRRGSPYPTLDEVDAGIGLDPEPPRLGLVPPLLIEDDARWLRRTVNSRFAEPASRRRSMIRAALERFARSDVGIPGWGGQSFAGFEDMMWRHQGLPPPLTRRWAQTLQEIGNDVEPTDQTGLVAVSLPANTFLCLESCLAALLGADAVWFRPSRREPFAAARLIGALVEAGWPAERLGFYPSGHDGLRALSKVADLTIVYGGEVAEGDGQARPACVLRGPGRGVALIGDAVDPAAAVAWLADKVAGNAGRFCTNVGTILCRDADAIGRPLAARLDAIAVGRAPDPCFPQALHPAAEVVRIEAWLAQRMRAGDEVLTRRLLGGGGQLHPILIRLADPFDHPLLGLELPFAAAVIAQASVEDHPRLTAGSAFIYGFPALSEAARKTPAPGDRETADVA